MPEDLDEDEREIADDTLDEEDLAEDPIVADDDLDDADIDSDEVVDLDVDVVEGDAAPVAPTKGAGGDAEEATDEDEDVVIELDDEQHPDDVEAPLDTLLQERTASATLEDDEEEVEEEEGETAELGEGPAKIVPRRPGEFLCTSCFLVLPRNQLADEKRMLCRDCA